MEQVPVISPLWRHYCNTIYLKHASWFDLGSIFKVVNFIWQSSNSIDLLIIHNGWVIAQKIDDDNYRPWDYPENFGIYSQLRRKSKTWFFTFLNLYVSWIERYKILILQLSPPKFRYFAYQNGPKEGPHNNEFWQFSNTKMNITNS